MVAKSASALFSPRLLKKSRSWRKPRPVGDAPLRLLAIAARLFPAVPPGALFHLLNKFSNKICCRRVPDDGAAAKALSAAALLTALFLGPPPASLPTEGPSSYGEAKYLVMRPLAAIALPPLLLAPNFLRLILFMNSFLFVSVSPALFKAALKSSYVTLKSLVKL